VHLSVLLVIFFDLSDIGYRFGSRRRIAIICSKSERS
jgi:hypothetical protein